ncbi:Uncharacterized protein dnm_055240 [Desulfonema magnum]|uniref:Uncharacterized protein n=1 Tax=Desulfonema magnum TaxID=45655 RepID=A0A975BPY0_9BACT|nr:Uncharacterized protein dnm_055240 [Desulfonema magnum]
MIIPIRKNDENKKKEYYHNQSHDFYPGQPCPQFDAWRYTVWLRK